MKIQDVELEEGDIVWSGTNGGQSGEKVYHIKFVSRFNTKTGNSGCWCPKEAVSFLRSIGITVDVSRSYNSGFSAKGCRFNDFPSPMSYHILEAYNQGNINKHFVHLLQRAED